MVGLGNAGGDFAVGLCHTFAESGTLARTCLLAPDVLAPYAELPTTLHVDTRRETSEVFAPKMSQARALIL